MRHLTTFLLLMAVCSTTYAGQDPLVITKAGYFLLQIGEDGIPQCMRLTNIIDLTDGTSPPVGPGPVDPPPPVLNKVQSQVSQWALLAGDFDNSQAIALVYEKMRDELKKGNLNVISIWAATRTGTDAVLTASTSTEQWVSFRANLTVLTRGMTAKGELGTSAQIQAFYTDVAAGLVSVVPKEHPSLTAADAVNVLSACDRIIQATKDAAK